MNIKQVTELDDRFTPHRILRYNGEEFLRVRVEGLADINALGDPEDREIVTALNRAMKDIPWDLERMTPGMRDQFDESGFLKVKDRIPRIALEFGGSVERSLDL